MIANGTASTIANTSEPRDREDDAERDAEVTIGLQDCGSHAYIRHYMRDVSMRTGAE